MTRAILLTGQCYFFTWGERIAAEEEPGARGQPQQVRNLLEHLMKENPM
jgi:hypothetical protein